jgi:hypothetical protein
MSNNKLMEAAAEILSGSKKSAPAMPPERLPGEVQDLGGPTPQNAKHDDDSNKIHASGKAPDHSGKNKASIAAKPSAASSDTQLKLGGGKKEMHEEEEYDDETIDEASGPGGQSGRTSNRNVDYSGVGDAINKAFPGTSLMHKNKPGSSNVSVKRVKDADVDGHKKDGWYHPKQKTNEEFREDVDAMFADDDTISEDFKNKASTIFEARVFDRVSQIQEELEAEYAGKLEEAVELIESELTEKVDDYLNYVVEQWMEENQLAIESGLRAELAEEFIAGLRNLFAEHYVDVPAEKVDLVDELATKVEELESKLNEEMERNIEFSKALVESHKAEVTREVCEGLTTTQFEKIKTLAEGVDYSTEEEFKEKIETIRENYFPSGIKKANAQQLHEQVEDTDTEKKVINDPFVNAVSQAISKTKF